MTSRTPDALSVFKHEETTAREHGLTQNASLNSKGVISGVASMNSEGELLSPLSL